MTGFSRFWADLAPRERILVAIAAALLSLIILWLGLLRPLDRATADARRRHDRTAAALADARAQATAIFRLRNALPTASGAPADIAAAAAAAAGFPLTRSEPAGEDAVTLAIEAARPAALWPWIDELQRRGLTVSDLSVRANPDRTVAVRLTLTARRA